jgi:hypothetical protein
MPSVESSSVVGPWLDLSEAARFLGVHFTTLRRWADITEPVRTFLLFGHSMLGAVQQAGSISGSHDVEGLRLYERMSDFLDAILLATVESYRRSSAAPPPPALPPASPPGPSRHLWRPDTDATHPPARL